MELINSYGVEKLTGSLKLLLIRDDRAIVNIFSYKQLIKDVYITFMWSGDEHIQVSKKQHD